MKHAQSTELALERARRRVLARLVALEERLSAGDEGAWTDYLIAAQALALLALEHRSEAPPALLTAGQLAERLGYSTRTIRRRRDAGQLAPVIGEGRGARYAPPGTGNGTRYGTGSQKRATDAGGHGLARAVQGGRAGK